MTLAPVIALSHGGGPMPLLGDPNHATITASLQQRVPKILGLNTPSQPAAIVMVTAHWTTDQPTISNGSSHDLLYDYRGFPPESYELKYPAPGEPEVAAKIAAAFAEQGLSPKLDAVRKWDHGVFVPLLLINPKANIPIIQVSVLESEDAGDHIKMGKALATLRASNIAILGSGFASLHHFTLFRALSQGDQEVRKSIKESTTDPWNEALTGAIKESTEGNWDGLLNWRNLPHANEIHPVGGGEHFTPLLVCAGAAKGDKVHSYKDSYYGQDIVTFYWGADEIA
ncbi:hypothetical protein VHEMI02427 [[Torrubiella] hemipterigena]|uniref:Extradiol ring-cleavage dioxygenase class III enzyme subunit B domain-containing protein n=1 Tax=[Torrubiella] hemipterigena TaxID=1531966 RepID=A0A0A1SPK0_9HYPO|nr:hypothetical protein VHEMI02427 [[Torrubiella] hemipterigena]